MVGSHSTMLRPPVPDRQLSRVCPSSLFYEIVLRRDRPGGFRWSYSLCLSQRPFHDLFWHSAFIRSFCIVPTDGDLCGFVFIP